MTDNRLLYNKADAATQLGISERVLDRLIVDGEVEVVRIGRRVLVPHDCLEDYIQRLRRAS